MYFLARLLIPSVLEGDAMECKWECDIGFFELHGLENVYLDVCKTYATR